jgi:hypothetical protein
LALVVAMGCCGAEGVLTRAACLRCGGAASWSPRLRAGEKVSCTRRQGGQETGSNGSERVRHWCRRAGGWRRPVGHCQCERTTRDGGLRWWRPRLGVIANNISGDIANKQRGVIANNMATSPTNNVASSPTTWRHHQHDSATTHWAHFEGDLAWHKSALSKPCACKNTGGTYLPSSSPPCLGQNTLAPSPDFDCAPPPASSSCDPHRGSTSGAPQEDGTPEEDAVDSLQRQRAVVRNGELAHGVVP